MEAILLVVQLLLAAGLIGVVLIQKSDSDGFGLGSGGSSGGMGMFSARGQANFLTRATAILATLFILNSLALSIIAANSSDRGSLADRLEAAEKIRTPVADDTVFKTLVGGASDDASEADVEPLEEAPAVPKAE